MTKTSVSGRREHHRAIQAILDVLPRAARVEHPLGGRASQVADLVIGEQPVEVKWVGEGSLGRVNALIAHAEDGPNTPRIVVARRLSTGARKRLTDLGIGWVDETGAAEIVLGSLIVSKSDRAPARPTKEWRWTRSVLAVAEAVLVGTRPTVADARAATGLSSASCANALRFLTDRGLLEADARRGRNSARRLVDPDRLLEAYAAAAESARGAIALTAGTSWRDPVSGLAELGRRWDEANVSWAASGLAAAAVMAPLVTNVTSIEVYVDADTPSGLDAVAREAALRPIDGGRLTLSPFPTASTNSLASTLNGLRVAPWPRVLVDLRRIGVRGEEAAEHLREVINGS